MAAQRKRKRRTRTFPPRNLLEEDQRDSFGNGATLAWQTDGRGLPPGVDPAQAVAAAMWQHLVVYGIETALDARGWDVKAFAELTPGISYDSWLNVLAGRSLLGAHHVGAAAVTLGGTGFLPPPDWDEDHHRAHMLRLAQVSKERSGPWKVQEWSTVPSLQQGWSMLRDELAQPMRPVWCPELEDVID